MYKSVIAGTVLLALVCGSPRAQAGYMYLEWLDCDPTYKLWAVSWKGPWNVLGGKHLDKAKTNRGPWSRVLAYVSDSNCYFPGQNLRWYRISKPGLTGSSRTLASIWVPRSRCTSGFLW
jgi:hypothetical protein